MTVAEQCLWQSLRRKQISGFKFRRQHPFGDYIIDFVCLETKLAIEVDGGQHNTREAEDKVRTAYLERAGFRVLRFWNNEVMNDVNAVTEQIWQALRKIDPIPTLSLPLKGRESQ